MFAIFHSLGNFPRLMQDWEINSSGLQIDLSLIFYMQMLIISYHIHELCWGQGYE